MRVAIITIGTELTNGRVVDTNSGFISSGLERKGLRVVLVLTVPDDAVAISEGLAYVLDRDVSLVVISGGLGPTLDDITTRAIARTLDLETAIDPLAEEMVSVAVKRDPADLAPHQRKQAELPFGAHPLPPAGTAPGFIVKAGSVPIICLPGVPRELREMWDDALSMPEVASVIEAARAPGRRVLCFYRSGEPVISGAVQSFLADDGDGIDISICARYQEVVLEVVYQPDANDRVDRLMVYLKDRFGNQIYSEGDNIEDVLGNVLFERGRMLAVAESCTGGMLGEYITCVSGASRFFRGGVIAYANEIKAGILKVSQETLDAKGAVSETVASQLATGVMEACGADYGIGITGIAGPGGGTPEKPVGLVFIGLASRTGGAVQRLELPGCRQDVRHAAVIAAMHMLHRHLLEEDAEA